MKRPFQRSSLVAARIDLDTTQALSMYSVSSLRPTCLVRTSAAVACTELWRLILIRHRFCLWFVV